MSEVINVLTQHYGAEEALDSKPIYKNRKFKMPDRGSNIVVTDDLWIDNLTGTGGRGAINLVMHLEGFTQKQFPQAKAIVDGTSGHSVQYQQSINKPIGVAPANSPAEKKQELEKVEPSVAKWPQVKTYLVEKRKIPEQLVDVAYASGKVFADVRGNVVFARDDESGYFKRSSSSNFKQTVGQGGKPFNIKGSDGRLYITEAPIDALTIKALNPTAAVIATGGHATPLENLRPYLAKAGTVYLAFDNDEAGNKFIASMVKAFPDVEFKDHIPPIGCKDWNQYLQSPDSSYERELSTWKERGTQLANSTKAEASHTISEPQLEKKCSTKSYGFGG